MSEKVPKPTPTCSYEKAPDADLNATYVLPGTDMGIRGQYILPKDQVRADLIQKRGGAHQCLFKFIPRGDGSSRDTQPGSAYFSDDEIRLEVVGWETSDGNYTLIYKGHGALETASLPFVVSTENLTAKGATQSEAISRARAALPRALIEILVARLLSNENKNP